MKKSTVYDLPTRIFHWLFAFFFLAAYIIASTVDDESALFSYHMLAGLTVGFLLILRLVWGFAGTAYARFNSFKLNPFELFQYVKDAVVSKTKRYLSHNPASSYAAIIMFICAAGLAISGISMASGTENEFYEEAHELLATIFLITVIAHVVGVLYHQFKHRDALWSSMIDGLKKAIPGKSGITATKRFAGILFFIFTLLWVGYLNNQYDQNNRTLNVFGQQLTLGEEEHESHSESEGHETEEESQENE